MNIDVLSFNTYKIFFIQIIIAVKKKENIGCAADTAASMLLLISSFVNDPILDWTPRAFLMIDHVV